MTVSSYITSKLDYFRTPSDFSIDLSGNSKNIIVFEFLYAFIAYLKYSDYSIF